MVLSQLRALFSFALLAVLAGGALADPPTRVARLAHVSGDASFSPGGEREWGRASINRPLVTGDRLWINRGSRAALQVGTLAVRADGGTSITLLNLDDRITQIQLSQGTLQVSVRRLDRGQVVEIATPNLAFSIRRPGDYRIDVSTREDSTTVATRRGLAEVFGGRRAFVVGERQSFTFYGAGLDDYDVVALRAPDEFERWAAARDRRWSNSPSRRFVSAEMIGYEDLDQFGTWKKVDRLGPVWVPRVAADWAPYRDGHWSWVEPWGWTWIDAAPWGFAPSHYGRWTRLDNSWAWVPGPADTRPVYAPALVAFVGNGSPGAASSTVAWFPLGPRDVYRPTYTASREYFHAVNASNARVDRQVVTTYYDNRSAPATYTNQQVPGAIIAMLAAAFSQSRPVAPQTARVSEQSFSKAPVMFTPPVVPQQVSVVGPAAAPAVRPPEATPARPVFSKVAPPPPPPSFAAKQGALAANAGKPLDPAAVAALKPAAPASAAAVQVVPETKAVAVPKMPASAASAAAGRRGQRQRGGEAPAAGAADAPAAPASAAPAAATPAPAAPAASGKAESPAAATPPAKPATSTAPPAGAPAARPTPPASAASAPTPADATPGAAGRQRAREAREERGRGSDRTPREAQPPEAAASERDGPRRAPTAPAAATKESAPAPAPAPAKAPVPVPQRAPAPAAGPASAPTAAPAPAPAAVTPPAARPTPAPAPAAAKPPSPPEQAARPASAPAPAAATPPAPAPAAAPARPARAASTPTPADAAAPAAPRATASEQRGPRARPAAAAASDAAEAASEPQRGGERSGERGRGRDADGQRRP